MVSIYCFYFEFLSFFLEMVVCSRFQDSVHFYDVMSCNLDTSSAFSTNFEMANLIPYSVNSV